MKPKIGMIVLYTGEPKYQDPHSAVLAPNPEYPAIIYQVYPRSSEGAEGVGLHVFTEDGLRLMRKVLWSDEKTPGTFRFMSQD